MWLQRVAAGAALRTRNPTYKAASRDCPSRMQDYAGTVAAANPGSKFSVGDRIVCATLVCVVPTHNQ